MAVRKQAVQARIVAYRSDSAQPGVHHWRHRLRIEPRHLLDRAQFYRSHAGEPGARRDREAVEAHPAQVHIRGQYFGAGNIGHGILMAEAILAPVERCAEAQ